jgi:phosphate transport system ATP-binding protein
MVDLRPTARVEGEVLLRGKNIFASDVNPAQVRRRIGLIPQAPSLFPTSLFENVAFGPKMAGFKGDLSGLVEGSLKKAGLWDEVGGRLFEAARGLSDEQRLRLCVARALAVGPEVLLMDEPMSTLDPGASQRIEELMERLRSEHTIVIVTNSMQQAARVSDLTAFLEDGEMVEYGPTDRVFTNPREERTEAYVTGRHA